MKTYNYAAFRELTDINLKGTFHVSIYLAFGTPHKINRKKYFLTQPFHFNAKSITAIAETMNKLESNCRRLKSIRLYSFTMTKID